MVFIEIVWYAASVEDGKGRGVERVLWDCDHDTGLGLRADGVEESVDA